MNSLVLPGLACRVVALRCSSSALSCCDADANPQGVRPPFQAAVVEAHAAGVGADQHVATCSSLAAAGAGSRSCPWAAGQLLSELRIQVARVHGELHTHDGPVVCEESAPAPVRAAETCPKRSGSTRTITLSSHLGRLTADEAGAKGVAKNQWKQQLTANLSTTATPAGCPWLSWLRPVRSGTGRC